MSDEEPDFVWQHQYGKRWISYSGDCTEVLNKAVKRWQKTVSIPDNDPKKNIIVYLDEMYQINKVSSKRQKVRCAVYSEDFYTWSWLDDDGEWSSYKPRLVFLLELAYQKDVTEITFYDNGNYKVYLTSQVQINEESNYSHRVRREKVDASITSLFKRALFESKFKEMCFNSSISLTKRWINLPSLSTVHSSLSSTPGNIHVPTPSTFQEIDETLDEYLPPDHECPVKTFHVYQENGFPCAATLSYVNMSANNNKFSILQVLKHNSKDGFKFWQRFGRVGTQGQSELKDFGTNLLNAKAAFETKFLERTGNSWSDIKNFNYIYGKYNLLRIDLNPEKDCKIETAKVQLEPPVKSLMDLICNKKVMDEILKEMFYDSTNAPLGKLTFKQITDGYIALNKIAEVISRNGEAEELLKRCEEFYMKIPHNFGKKNPPVIQTKEDIEQKMELLKALSNIRLTMTVLSDAYPEHPLNRCYNSFKYSLVPLEQSGKEFATLFQTLLETHGPTHSTYNMTLTDVFRCHEKGPSTYLDCGNKHLLWHGSRITNWVGILQKGLKIAPPEAPSTGDYFGNGLYFADVCSKSANYCQATKRNNEGLLLLCEVSLGNQLECQDSDSTFPQSLNPSYDSVFGKGRVAPSNFQTGILSFDAKIPVGPLVQDFSSAFLQYNEYVVYNVNQVLDESRSFFRVYTGYFSNIRNGGAHRPSEERMGKTLSNGLKSTIVVVNFNKWDDMMCLANVYFFLDGTARQWYVNNEDALDSWEAFKNGLSGLFGDRQKYTRRAEEQLKFRAQRSGESTQSYTQSVLGLCQEVNPLMKEDEKVSHLMKGVAEDIYQALLKREIKDTVNFIK
ncbi:poly polymerase 2 [Trichonephila inaurata madagascariensis]|uniref:Poly [ADP-ribose] polymerase n=1 Tax=Trichonephila inaurata madagascariensis TaxID=2747483 RepID=A0A8X6YVJ1_9ARAC|nr:poly polymerase 2 [Trichonephila inaurata madagascariensis]